ncbi:phosphotransferase enzyme family protein [Nocardia nova SH22a]|uniref:Phosphotransferase enzyme family protein n=1 Tax=Nocardia nova SH22a TaxID=1415166 RepID=W5TEY0_9NOCA|nr:phosphotransferase [Nocardia nova]AHH17792.1 phosphotransferase enzyme family protein [Nocardia nova SH22a]
MISPVSTTIALGTAAREAVRAAADLAIPSGTAIPLRVADLTAPRVSRLLGLPDGAVTAVRVLGQDSGTAARARIEVSGDTGLPPHLFLKLMPRNYLQHVLMNVFRLGAREVLAYRALGDDPPVRVPRCHLAEIDPMRGRCALILEDLSATAEFRTVVDSVTRAEAEAVTDALANLHAAFWETGRFTGDLRPLACRSAAEIRVGDLVRRRFLARITGHCADLIPESIRDQCRIFYRRSADIDAFWAAQPQTLIHGDPHLGNLFFEHGRPGFLDWQVATAGPGIRDLAYFVTVSVRPELLRDIEYALVQRYSDRLAAAGIPADARRMWTLYRAAITEPFLAMVCTAEAGERMQPRAVSRVGVERAVAAVRAHDSFSLLAELIDHARDRPADILY